MKKYFFTGLAVFLPTVITILVIVLLVNLLTQPFQEFVEEVLQYYGLLGKPILFLSASQVLRLISKLLILVFLFGLSLLVGFLTQIVITRYLIRLGDFVIHKIPVVNKIYKAAQDVVKILFAEKREPFSQTVLAPFPYSNVFSIGMITSESLLQLSDSKDEKWISVFLPASPNPIMGFNVMLKRDQLIYLDLSVEEALMMIISCGVIFNRKKEKQNDGNGVPAESDFF
ncbi:MAG: DUF502 domain-containing protein [Waddliaceae bacterium]